MNIESQRGDWRFGPIIGLVIVVLAIIGLFAVCFDDDDGDGDIDTLGRLELVSHDYGCDPAWEDCGGRYGDSGDDWNSDQRNHNGRERGAFSPGPFEDSPVDFRDNCISLDCGGRERQEDQPQ